MPAKARKTKKRKTLPRSMKSTSRGCGLCGKTQNLTKTPCCGQWICDDADNYVMFSYARNCCYRNHDRYTLCAFHFHEGHQGHWKDCQECRGQFDAEMYAYYCTNEYNFEVLENPPEFELQKCRVCGKEIDQTKNGFVSSAKGLTCAGCSDLDFL